MTKDELKEHILKKYLAEVVPKEKIDIIKDAEGNIYNKVISLVHGFERVFIYNVKTKSIKYLSKTEVDFRRIRLGLHQTYFCCIRSGKGYIRDYPIYPFSNKINPRKLLNDIKSKL